MLPTHPAKVWLTQLPHVSQRILVLHRLRGVYLFLQIKEQLLSGHHMLRTPSQGLERSKSNLSSTCRIRDRIGCSPTYSQNKDCAIGQADWRFLSLWSC